MQLAPRRRLRMLLNGLLAPRATKFEHAWDRVAREAVGAEPSGATVAPLSCPEVTSAYPTRRGVGMCRLATPRNCGVKGR